MHRPLIASPYLGIGLGAVLAALGGINLWRSRTPRPESHETRPPTRLVRNITLVAWALVLLSGAIIAAGEIAIILAGAS